MAKEKLANRVKSELSAPVYLQEDLERMKEYQNNLFGFLLYSNEDWPINEVQKARSKVLLEIQNVERWLKKHYTQFVHNNNRKFIG